MNPIRANAGMTTALATLLLASGLAAASPEAAIVDPAPGGVYVDGVRYEVPAPDGVYVTPTLVGVNTVRVAASDPDGVARVDLLMDNRLLGSDSSAPYEFALDATKLGGGEHVLIVRAYNAAGEMGGSSLTVVTAPTTQAGVQATSSANLFFTLEHIVLRLIDDVRALAGL